MGSHGSSVLDITCECGREFTSGYAYSAHFHAAHGDWAPRNCKRCGLTIVEPEWHAQKYHYRCTPLGHPNLRVDFTRGEYEDMFAAQDGKCALCGRDGKMSLLGLRRDHPLRTGVAFAEHDTLRIDHCHLTGQVRGLLCLQCNRNLVGTLEYFDRALVLRALEYIDAV